MASSDRKRRRYTAAFKAEAVRLAVEGERSIAALARDLELRPDQLRKWKQEAVARGEVAPTAGRALTAADRIAQLKRELAVVRQERDFLKKATLFFARESP